MIASPSAGAFAQRFLSLSLPLACPLSVHTRAGEQTALRRGSARTAMEGERGQRAAKAQWTTLTKQTKVKEDAGARALPFHCDETPTRTHTRTHRCGPSDLF